MDMVTVEYPPDDKAYDRNRKGFPEVPAGKAVDAEKGETDAKKVEHEPDRPGSDGRFSDDENFEQIPPDILPYIVNLGNKP
jgi:hypothetical protein